MKTLACSLLVVVTSVSVFCGYSTPAGANFQFCFVPIKLSCCKWAMYIGEIPFTGAPNVCATSGNNVWCAIRYTDDPTVQQTWNPPGASGFLENGVVGQLNCKYEIQLCTPNPQTGANTCGPAWMEGLAAPCDWWSFTDQSCTTSTN